MYTVQIAKATGASRRTLRNRIIYKYITIIRNTKYELCDMDILDPGENGVCDVVENYFLNGFFNPHFICHFVGPFDNIFF